MTVMTDLKDAIEHVLIDAAAWDGTPWADEKFCKVDRRVMKQLQAEYNIHFIEPDEEQIEWITKHT